MLSSANNKLTPLSPWSFLPLAVLASIVWLVVFTTACAAQKNQMATADVTINGHVIHVQLAETPAEQSRGLGGRRKLGPNEGMLFLYPTKSGLSFWMKDMLISIDMIWLDNTQVVHIESKVPYEPPGTPDSQLPTYSSPTPANGVLELAAGRAQELGLKIGGKISISFNSK